MKSIVEFQKLKSSQNNPLCGTWQFYYGYILILVDGKTTIITILIIARNELKITCYQL